MSNRINQIQIAGNYAQWVSVQEIPSLDYVCWHCNTRISSNRGYLLTMFGRPSYNSEAIRAGIYLCHRCGYPTFLLNGKQIPGVPFGEAFKYVPDDVNKIYNEARNCYSVNAFTAVVLLCRKILMHIGVNNGAETNKSFKFYVDYLKDHNLIAAPSLEWVDKIRKIGNQANHELIENTAEEAKNILTFTSMILATIYEYPAKAENLN